MTDREALARTVAERGAYWVDVLRLNHWRIDVQVVDALNNDDALASCDPSDSYDSARIKIRYDLEDHRGEDQSLDYIIVHELLHIHFRDMHEAFQSTAGMLGSLGNGHRDRWQHEEEGLIDRLAYIILALHEQNMLPSVTDDHAQ